MATPTERGTGTIASGSSIVVSGVNIPTGDLGLAVFGCIAGPTPPDTITPTSSHGTWTIVPGISGGLTFTDSATFNALVQAWYIVGGGTNDVTFPIGSNGWTNAVVQIISITDVTVTSSGADAFVQDPDGQTGSGATSLAASLSAFGSGNNLCAITCCTVLDPIPTIDLADDGFTEYSGGQEDSGTILAIHTGWKTGEDTTPTADFGSDEPYTAVIGFELEDSGGGGGVSGAVHRRRQADLAALAAMTAPAIQAFGQIFNRSESGLMLPERKAA